MLEALQGGNRTVVGELFPLVYEELLAQAHRQRARWHGDHTLNTTALVHEAYLKLVDQTQGAWASRAHFLGVAAKAMRHILIDHAKARRAERRGGDVLKLSLDELKAALASVLPQEEPPEALLALDEALQRLEQENAREAQVVECRFFGGMTVRETAAALGVSPTTVKRDWVMAQAWLYREIQRE